MKQDGGLVRWIEDVLLKHKLALSFAICKGHSCNKKLQGFEASKLPDYIYRNRSGDLNYI